MEVVSKQKQFFIMETKLTKAKFDEIFKSLEEKPSGNDLSGYSTATIKEFIEYLEKNGDLKTADGNSTLTLLKEELKRREKQTKTN